MASGSIQAVAINPNGSIAGDYGSIPGVKTEPAVVGNTLTILATGLGLVTPAITDGAASRGQARTTLATPTVLVNGFPALVTFSGLSPRFVGVNQINVVVPEGAWGPGGGGGECPIQRSLLTRFAALTGGECGVLRNRAPTIPPARSVTRRRPGLALLAASSALLAHPGSAWQPLK
jgi:hypothetical protein